MIDDDAPEYGTPEYHVWANNKLKELDQPNLRERNARRKKKPPHASVDVTAMRKEMKEGESP